MLEPNDEERETQNQHRVKLAPQLAQLWANRSSSTASWLVCQQNSCCPARRPTLPHTHPQKEAEVFFPLRKYRSPKLLYECLMVPKFQGSERWIFLYHPDNISGDCWRLTAPLLSLPSDSTGSAHFACLTGKEANHKSALARHIKVLLWDNNCEIVEKKNTIYLCTFCFVDLWAVVF